MDTQELANRIYDELFDNVGTSEHHVALDHEVLITDQYVYNSEIMIRIDGKRYKINIEELDS